MATKGTSNFLGGIKNMFGKTGNAAPQEDPKESITVSHAREKEMLAKLKKIDLENPDNKLSPVRVHELSIEKIVRYAVGELKYPLVVEQDLVNLDNSMAYIIDALNRAIREGWDMTAEWACTALVCAVKSLRTEVDGTDEEYADALWECRVEYAHRLELLVKECIKYDELNAKLMKQQDRRRGERAELDRRKSAHLSRQESGELDNAMAELSQFAHDPSQLSDEAKAVRNELIEMRHLKDSIVEIDANIDAQEADLRAVKADIKSLRNALSNPPQVTDPQLQNKINEANRRYRKSLRDQLDNAEEALRAHNVHISAMKDLAQHSLHIRTGAEAIEEAQTLALERLKELQIAQQAATIRAQAAANSQFIAETIKVQEPVVETIEEPLVNIIEEPEIELEYE